MSFLLTDLSWATDATFSSGPIIGQPNKATPSAGMIAEGFDPEDPLAAEHANYLFNYAGLWQQFTAKVNNGRIYQFKCDFDYGPDMSTGAVDSTNTWVETLAGTGLSEVVSDSAANGFGAWHCKTTAGAGESNISFGPALDILHLPGDFYIGARARIITAGASSPYEFGLGAVLGAGDAGFTVSGGVWKAYINGSGTSSAVAAGTTYATLEIFRVSGTAYAYVNGTQVSSGALATTSTALFLGLVSASVAREAYTDYVTVLADRS